MARLRTLWMTKGILLLVSTGCALEFLYAPKVSVWNAAQAFPSIPVGVRFSIMEALVGTFVIIIGGYVFARRTFRGGRIYIAPTGYRGLTGLLLFSIILSFGIGIALSSPTLDKEIREFLIPGMLLFIFLNITVDVTIEYAVIQVFYWTGIGSLVVGSLVFFIPSSVPDLLTPPQRGFWIVLYAGIFSATWAAARLLWRGFAWKDLLLVLSALGVFLLHVTHKPIVFTFFVSLGALVVAALLSKEAEIISRARKLSLALPSILVTAFVVIPQSVLNEFINIIAWRYLKIQNISSFEELQSSFGQVGQRQDLSAGRFAIWQSYFQDAVSGLGLAPDGLGGAAEVYTPLQGYLPGFPAHNTVAYLSYHAGYVASISYVLIVGLFLYQGFRSLPCRGRHDSVFETVDLVAIFAFTVGIIAVGLVGGPLKDYRLAWFFWFSVAVLVRRWSALTNVKTGS